MPNLVVNKTHVKSGDTIIEVVFAITIFCLVAVLSVGLMNEGLRNSESTLELTVVRNEINAQAEALRYIQSNYSVQKSLGQNNNQYAGLWDLIEGKAIEADNLPDYPISNCADAYNSNIKNSQGKNNPTDKLFIVNPRLLSKLGESKNEEIIAGQSILNTAPVLSRLVFESSLNSSTDTSDDTINDNMNMIKLKSAEGIWNIVAYDETSMKNGEPKFYDFYIRSCWYSPGKTTPTTIGTVIRLNNPDYNYGN